MHKSEVKNVVKQVVKKVIYYDRLKLQKEKIRHFIDKRRSVSGKNKYTVVSAVYNVDKYLEDFFESIVNQTLKFEDHINLIMIDDGSTDDSSEIIKKWQIRFPNNIIYLKKENGGQASARNYGMSYVRTEWVTFVDPDDYLDYRYFEEVDNFLGKNEHKNIGLVSCNTLYYNDKTKQLRDQFYLKFCFKKKEKIVNLSSMEGCMQFTTNSAFFQYDLLKKHNNNFKENIRPNFEDAHFVNQYFIDNNTINIAYLKGAKYIYRKRSDGTSTMDTAWKSTEKYSDVLEKGYLDILYKSQEKLGYIPLYLQRTILSEMTGYFKNILNNPTILEHLTKNQINNYLKITEEIFSFIDKKTIETFNHFGTSYMDKVGFLGSYKKSEISVKRCYIDDYNPIKNEIRIRFYYYDTLSVSFYEDGKVIQPVLNEVKKHNFVDKLFVKESIVYLAVSKSIKRLKIDAGDDNILILMDGKIFENEVEMSRISQNKKFNKNFLLLKKIIKRIIFYDRLKQNKKSIQILFDKKRRVSGSQKYTIVSAVYNVGKYLEEYFESITTQTLNFEEHIELIMVDDGSTDDSSKIIKKWQTKYPDNIIYIKKENGGQASARNLGMEYVQTEWVTFVDPDDFLDYRYFEEIDIFLTENKKDMFSMISCNFIFYYENQDRFSDTHPLKYRFSNNETILESSNMGEFIQLTVNSVFFKNDLLRNKRIRFHDDIKPSFEDGYFVNQYLIENSTIKVAFLKHAKYFYRKRSDGTSTLDTSWSKLDRYDKVLNNGYLRILNFAMEKENSIPQFLQRTILYELMWNHRYLLNDSSKLSHLNKKEKKKYLQLLQEIFDYIDIKTIESFELAGCWFFYKIAYFGFYKQKSLPYQVCYIEDFDAIKSQIKLHYYYYYEEKEVLTLNDEPLEAVFSKKRMFDFVEKEFVYEKILWISFSDYTDYLKVEIGHKKVSFSIKGRKYNDSISIAQINKSFTTKLKDTDVWLRHIIPRKLYSMRPIEKKFQNTWLLMDRDTQADDNAEHLYRYIKKNHKEIEMYFVLRKNSHDWDRLRKEGFNLLAFGSYKHRLAYVNAKYIISSHADNFVTDYLPRRWYNDIIKHKFIFLQHGVIHTDLSRWLNRKKIDCFLCTGIREYHSIVDDFTPYKFTKKEVVLTGLPRHDDLLSGAGKREKMILVMPTWREYLVGDLVGIGHERLMNQNFGKTSYLNHWKNFLHSERLEILSKVHGYKVLFSPHANIQPYLDIFDMPDYIETLTHSKGSIQSLFQRASILITDYSSVAFEMGILQKEVIYYQFDHIKVLGGGHTFKKGYFDYVKDGFGPVCYTEIDILKALEQFFNDEGKVEEKYMKRMRDFFMFHDTNNCKRSFEAIQNLNKPHTNTIFNNH